MNASSRGNLIVVSGPSGAGKTTLLKKLLERCEGLSVSVSATTRPPRPGETDGVDYFFLTSEEFQRKREAEEFLECFEVFGHGYWYGTLQSEVAFPWGSSCTGVDNTPKRAYIKKLPPRGERASAL